MNTTQKHDSRADDELFSFIVSRYQIEQQLILAHAKSAARTILSMPSEFSYSRWRHGGWYVQEIHYPDFASGCVSRNYPDKKWRIVCDPRRTDLNVEGDYTFRSRDEAAKAEHELALQAWIAKKQGQSSTGPKAPTPGTQKSTCFDVPVTFNFEGTVKILADTAEQAAEIARSSIGMTLNGGLHESDSRIRDWRFDAHSVKHVGLPTCRT